LLTGLQGLKPGDLITAVGGESTLSLMSVESFEAMCQTHADAESGVVELTLHHNSKRRRCGPAWRDPPGPGCRYRVEGFYSRCDGVYESEEHKHNDTVVPAFINQKNQIRISWNPDKKKWFARCISKHTLFASLRAKPKAEWLDELESRRWQEAGMGRATVSVTREFSEELASPGKWTKTSGSTAVTGSGAGGHVSSSGHDTDPEDNDLREAFHLFDTDGSGYFDKEEFREIMMMMTAPPNSEHEVATCFDENEFEQLFKRVDADGSGLISLDEYMMWAKEAKDPTKLAPIESPTKTTPVKPLSASQGLMFDQFDFGYCSDNEDEGNTIQVLDTFDFVESVPVVDKDEEAEEQGDSDDDDVEEDVGRNCLLACCCLLCGSLLRWLGRYLEVAEAGEWLVEGPLNLGLGDYFASYRFTGRLYWVYLQIKLFLLAVAIVFLPPVPIIQASVFLVCEILHLLSVLWVMPFVNFFNHISAVISSVLAIILYIGFVGAGLLGDPSRYSSLYVFVHMAILAQALITQLWPILVILAQVFTALVMALDMSELLGGGDEGPSESAVTLQRAANRLKLLSIGKREKISPESA
jgi:hypothetical protein